MQNMWSLATGFNIKTSLPASYVHQYHSIASMPQHALDAKSLELFTHCLDHIEPMYIVLDCILYDHVTVQGIELLF